MKRLIFAQIFLFALVSNAFAERTDSLEVALSKAQQDTAKLFLLDELVWEYLYSDIDKAAKYAQQAVKLGEEVNPKSFLARAHHSLATVLLQQNLNDSALVHFKIAISIYEPMKLEEKMASSYNGLGNVYLYQGVLEKALENYIKSLQLLEKNNAPKQKIGLVTSNVGIVYFNMEKNKEAIEYYNKALNIAEETGDSSGIASAYTNLGNVFKNMDKYTESKKYFTDAIAIYEKLGEDFGLANCLANMGAMAKNDKDLVKAMEYYQRGMEIFTRLKSDDGICVMYFDFAGIYFEKKDYAKALENLNKSLEIAKKIKARNRIMEAYELLHEIYKEMKEPEKAYESLLLYMASKDSVLNEENSKNMSRMQTLYETNKIEKELMAREGELKEKNLQQKGLIAVGAMLLVLVFVAYLGYRSKKKANIEITFQKEIIEQKNKDITDSINYAKRIQNAILPSKEFTRKLFPQSFVYYQPRDIVSGDFYFFAEVGSKKFAAACDCTGHGVPGAFMSMIGNDFLHRIVNELGITDTGRILSELHKNILQAMHQDIQKRTTLDGMDVALFCFDTEKKQVHFSGALRPLYCFDAAGFREIKGDRFSIGGETAEFASQVVSYQGNPTFYIFSDGYADQFGGADGKKFMAKRFKDLLASIQGKSMEDQEKALDHALQNWKKDREQVDDILVIGIRV